MELVVLVPSTALLFPGTKSVVTFVLNNLRWEILVRVIDIGVIVDH